MAQRAKHLAHRNEDLGSDPRSHVRADIALYIFYIFKMGGRDRILEASEPARTVEVAVKGRPCPEWFSTSGLQGCRCVS